MVCHASDLPRSGSYRTLDLYRDSILVVRTSREDIKAFLNVCRHRGAKLLEGSGDCSRHIRCPYHGWTYDFGGALKAVPGRKSFPGIDATRLGLNPVDLEIFHGFVFVRITGSGPSVAQMWGKYSADLEAYRFHELEPIAPLEGEEWDVNWKIAVENNLEPHHVPMSHPALYRVVSSPSLEDSLGSGVMRGVNRLREKPSSRWSERAYQRHTANVSQYLPVASRKLFRFFSVLPNLAIDVYPELVRFLHIVPLGPRRCIIRVGVYGLNAGRREARDRQVPQSSHQSCRHGEDRDICRRAQFGVMSRDYLQGPLSTQEEALGEFHDMLREAVPTLSHSVAPPAGSWELPCAFANDDSQVSTASD